MANKRKTTTAIVAGVTAAALLLGGTFAWQSINQTALNEASDVINPGGRLHDDFNGSNKDVYVENFADEDIFARIQLSEYFAIIANYGKDGAETRNEIIGEMITNEDGSVTYNYETYLFGDNANGDGSFKAAVDDDGNPYWNWTTGGSTVFMPTFNLNKDSLVADLNGNYVDAIGGISNRDDEQYTDYKEYEVDETEEGTEIYDGDTDMEDEVGTDFENLGNYTDSIVTVDNVTHTAQNTLTTTGLISMADWLAMVDAAGGYDAEAHGNYWVYDTDGWVYWSAPIAPDTATGLLLDGIELNGVMDDTWYYAINVVAQFVTADDVGNADNSGFYDTANGTVPTGDAETLLGLIGVEMDGEAGGDEGGDTENTVTTSGAIDLSTTTEANVYPATSYTLSNGTGETYTYTLTSGTEYAVLEGNVLTVNGDAADGSAIVVEGTNGTDTVTLNLTVSHDIIWKLSDGTVVEDWDEISVDSTISAYWGETKLPISQSQGASAEDEDPYVYNEDYTELTFNWGDERYWLSAAYTSDVLNKSEWLAVDVRWDYDVTASISINGGDYVAIEPDEYFHLDAGDTVALKATTTVDGVEVSNLAETEWFIGVNGNIEIDDELGTGTTDGSAYGVEFIPDMTNWPQEDQYCFYVQLWGYNYLYFTIQFGEPEILLDWESDITEVYPGESYYLDVNDEDEYEFTITEGTDYASVITDEYGAKMLTVNENATLNTTVTIQIMYEGNAITKTVTVVPAPTLTFTYTEDTDTNEFLQYGEFLEITVDGYTFEDGELFNWEIVQGGSQAPASYPGVVKHYDEGKEQDVNCPGETIIKVSLKSDSTVYGVFKIYCE